MGDATQQFFSTSRENHLAKQPILLRRAFSLLSVFLTKTTYENETGTKTLRVSCKKRFTELALSYDDATVVQMQTTMLISVQADYC